MYLTFLEYDGNLLRREFFGCDHITDDERVDAVLSDDQVRSRTRTVLTVIFQMSELLCSFFC